MRARVVTVAVEARQVDAADARDAVVDDDELLVVAVERPLLGVERDADADAAEALRDSTNFRARGLEERQRRSRPEQHTHLDPPLKLREQVEQDATISIAHERELSRDVPACDVDVRLGARELICEPRQKARAVDQDLDVVAAARRRVAVGPEARRGLECSLPARPHGPAPVLRPHERFDPIADGRVGVREQIRIHATSLPNRGNR